MLPLLKRTIVFFLFIGLGLLYSCGDSSLPAPTQLTVNEGFVDPVGFYDATPVFSWVLPAMEGLRQSAYEIRTSGTPDFSTEGWGSDKTSSDQSLYVPYEGGALASRETLYWQVRYWDEDDQVSDWSPTASLTLGLLENEDWQAEWMGLPVPEDTTVFGLPRFSGQYYRKDFTLDGAVESATLYVTAKGIFSATLNGDPVSEDVLTPGWTPYQKRIETLTYDLTEQLNDGENTLGLQLAEGWYAGRIGYGRSQWTNEDPPRLLAQLEITLSDGSTQTILSGEDGWRATANGPVQFASIYDGVIYNAKLAMDGWDSPGFADEDWSEVLTEAHPDSIALFPKRHAPIRAKVELAVQEITRPQAEMVVFDLGQNMVGVPHLQVPMVAGDTLTVHFAEMLQTDGNLYNENYRSALSTDYYIAAEDGTIDWQPEFTFHGFRYVGLSGFAPDAKPDEDWVKGIVQFSDFDSTGTFTSSYPMLNQLQSNIRWGLRGNFLDIPTDCPQRDERMGWTGDAQVFAPTSLFNADVHAFWAAWLQSMREDQLADGAIPFVIPNLDIQRGSAGWGDAATIIPWELYYRTGDLNVLAENFDMMKKWVGYQQDNSTDHIANFFSFSDWLQPYPAEDRGNFGDTPQDLICTAFFARSTDLTARAATALGNTEEAAQYRALLASIKSAYQDRYYGPDGTPTNGANTQTASLLALGFNLLSEELRPRVTETLIGQIEAAEGHLRTGFLGTPLLAPTLDSLGYTDLAYSILFKETYPSWFYSINQGATTMWERWNSYSHSDGFGNVGMNSFNHYAYGAIGQWMYERVAGIAPLTPGYRDIRIAPVPGGPLTSAAANYASPYGVISSSWETEGDDFTLRLTIPANTTAHLELPAEADDKVWLDGEDITDRGERMNNTFRTELAPGEYEISVRK